MSIFLSNIHNFPQLFNLPDDDKKTFGEVTTDYNIIEKMLNLIPIKFFKDPNLKWLDPCSGGGYFMICLYFKLFKHLKNTIPNKKNRFHHIINNMIYIIEINHKHISNLKKIFGSNANIFCQDYLKYDIDNNIKFDFIIANPPYNIGKISVPTSINKNKHDTIWSGFIKKMINHLYDFGNLVVIIPSVWMKKSHYMNSFITQFHIKCIHTMNNTLTNKMFHGHAQTPTSYFHLIKKPTNNYTHIYDSDVQSYISFNINYSLPVHSVNIIKKLLHFVNKYGTFNIVKTNLDKNIRNNSITISKIKTNTHPFPNIVTCKLNNNNPILTISYTNKPCMYYNKPKLILAHKMYGLPYYDNNGGIGVYSKDNYIISELSCDDFLLIKKYLFCKLIYYIYESTRYRMKNLEKETFDFIPNILNIPNIIDIDDNILYNTFKLNNNEIQCIEDFFPRNIIQEHIIQ
jgi:hypothetical protein